MTESIVSFAFEGFEVRTAGDAENPMFVAVDVCKALEIKDASDACERIAADWKGKVSIPTLGGMQDLLCVNEPGLYELIFASRKPSAAKFRRWVFEEVLPAIRKTGKYETQPLTQIEILQQSIALLAQHDQRLSQIEQENQLLREKIALLEFQQEAIELETDANTAELERFRNGHGYYFSIAGWCAKHDIRASLQEMTALGRKAAALCRLRQISPQKVNDPRWGEINTYPDSVLMEVV